MDQYHQEEFQFSTFLEKPNFGYDITFGEEIASYIEGETLVAGIMMK